jgi:hypothetical protein
MLTKPPDWPKIPIVYNIFPLAKTVLDRVAEIRLQRTPFVPLLYEF